MDIDTVHEAISILEREGKPVSVCRMHALTGGSFRNVSKLFNEIKSNGNSLVSVGGNTL